MVDYSLCRNKLKENIEKIGKRDAKKIREGDNVYQLRIKTELNSFLGLSKPIPIEDVENRILKPSMQNMDAWSCSFSYRIPEIKKKDERIVALYLHLNEDNQKIEYRKTKDTNKDIRRDFVVKEKGAESTYKSGVIKIQLKIGEALKQKEINLLDFNENEFKNIITELNEKFPIIEGKKVHAWENHNRLAYYFKKNNIILDDSNIKSISFYIDDKDTKSIDRLREILGIKKGSYVGDKILTVLENIAGYLFSKPEIPYRLLIYRDIKPIKVEIISDTNKVDLKLVKGNISKDDKLQNFAKLLKTASVNGVLEINYVDTIQGIALNFDWMYSNPNSVEKFMVQAFKNHELTKFGIFGIYDVLPKKEKKHYRVKRIYKGPDITDIYWRIKFRLLTTDVDKNIKKDGGEEQMKKEEVKEPVEEVEVKVKREKQTYTKEFHKYAIEVLDRDGITEKYLKEQPLSVNVDGALVVKAMKDKFTEYADVDDKKMWKGIRQLDLVNRFKGKSKKRELNKIVKAKEKAVKVKEVKPKTTKTKVAEKKEEFEIIHIVRFVTNLKFNAEVKAEIEVGLFKKKKTKQVPVEFMKHYEEIVMYCGKENKDEEVVEDKMRELTNITSQEGKLLSITAQSMPNGKTYSIIDSKTFEVKKGE